MGESSGAGRRSRQRADVLLAEAGLAESRERAKRLIMAGLVFWNDKGLDRPVTKPGQPMAQGTVFTVQEPERFVGRGGHKLLTALNHFNLAMKGLSALDVGASTGGFTDCLLQHGAAKVYALDVGHGQLHWRLRSDPRVVCLEGINIRHASPDLIPEPVDLIVADCSFISLRLVLPPSLVFLKPGGRILALVKPQFEVGPGQTDKGVVRDEALRLMAVEDIMTFARDELGLTPQGFVASGIKGPKGNQEYIVQLQRTTNRDTLNLDAKDTLP
ncbi:MAG: TlyA family RNA methyltransferase [Deltaproteobacteria bacterium]|nr:TlyA family RNA methyltransferase [Deltaproteobacteria bacterium]